MKACSILAIILLCAMIVYPISVTLAADPSTGPFDVRDFGARGDGKAIDTQAIQKAIDACGAAGNGQVLFPEGRYLSGTLRLRSGTELHLAEGARLVGIVDVESYTGFDADTWGKSRWNHGLIVGEGLHDICITGAGVIDGNKVFDPQGEEKMRGPHTILLSDCRNVTLRGVTLRDSANYAFLFYGSSNVLVENVTFEGGWDGVHFRGKPDSWNRGVRITGCRFFTGDDSIAGHYVEDAIVEDCAINSSCDGVRLIGPARRLTFARCEFFGPGKFEHRTSRELHRTNMLAALCIQPSSWTPTPGPLEDLHVSDVTMRNVACALHVSLREDNSGSRLVFERLMAKGVYGPAISVESWADQPLGTVSLRDIDVEYAPGAFVDPRVGDTLKIQSPIQKPGASPSMRKLPVWGFYGRNIGLLQLDRVRFVTENRTDARPVIRVDNAEEVSLDHLEHSPLPPGATAIEHSGVKAVKRDDTRESPLPPRMKSSR